MQALVVTSSPGGDGRLPRRSFKVVGYVSNVEAVGRDLEHRGKEGGVGGGRRLAVDPVTPGSPTTLHERVRSERDTVAGPLALV